jgi:hypothetical protein
MRPDQSMLNLDPVLAKSGWLVHGVAFDLIPCDQAYQIAGIIKSP